MTDKKFISNFSDYSEGVNVSISENEILEIIVICEKVISFLENEIKDINFDKKDTSFSKRSFLKPQKDELFETLFELLKFSHAIKKSRSEQDKRTPNPS